MRLIKLGLLAAAIFAALLFSFDQTPKGVRHEIEDWIARWTAPDFDWPPDDITARDQAGLVAEMGRRGYKLTCYSGLQPEEKIGPNDDYLCWAIIKSAYDNVPARMVSFSFTNKKLSSVKLEFPESSFEALQSYLSRRLQQYPGGPSSRHKDIFGKPIFVWDVKDAQIMTSEPTSGKPITLLWSADEQWVKSR
ncbi:MAG TPA: hypothetical protein VLC92_04995 [Rhodocyclaceae bacterium]|nr:hypothetical protein [Rhodocyclaceae bacterium]